MGRVVDCAPPLPACITSGPMDVRLQDRGFWVGSSSNILSTASEVCNVFCIGTCLSSHLRGSKGDTSSPYCFGSHLDCCDQQLKQCFLCLVLGFFEVA